MQGVGRHWHNDGSFEEGVFSHVCYHIVALPELGGDTAFAHLGMAYDALPPEKQAYWSRLVSINATSGAMHPLVHDHPISGRRSIFLHLAMTGGVLERLQVTNDPEQAPQGRYRLLVQDELRALLLDYHNHLEVGLADDNNRYAVSCAYSVGDVVFTDNLAIAHRASQAPVEGLRILHRSTVKAMQPFVADHLPAVFNLELKLECELQGDSGVLVTGEVGFQWTNEKLKNMADDWRSLYDEELKMDWLH